jgi:L-fuculose-phosphate aldolase
MGKKAEHRLRKEVAATALLMSRIGLSPQRSGNVSARFGDAVLVTPSGVAYDDIGAADIVRMELDGTVGSGQLKPSSEAPFHLAVYNAFSEAAAIVHCHSMAATALACARMEIPAFHYMVAVAGGRKIPLAAYATFGTEALAQSIVAALRGHRACLLANHGQIAWSTSLGKALELAAEVETLARQYIDVLALGTPHILDDAEMDRVLARFRSYGKRDGPSRAR